MPPGLASASDEIRAADHRAARGHDGGAQRLPGHGSADPAAHRAQCPSAPDELLERALAVLSESFNADVVCVVSVWATVTSSRRSRHPGRRSVLSGRLALGPSRRCRGRHPAAGDGSLEPGSPDVPAVARRPGSADGGVRADVAPNSEPSDEMLVLYRSSGEPFAETDLHVLASVAYRLRIAAAGPGAGRGDRTARTVRAAARATSGVRVADLDARPN